MTRALTAGELVTIRSDQQYSKVRAVFIPQPEVFHALVNGAPGTNEAVTHVHFDTVTVGAFGKAIAGMTMYVYASGSSAGAIAGLVRVRSTTATTITFGRCSDIQWTDNMHLSVVDDFDYWSKLPLMPDETTVYMDDDVAYTNQNAVMKPVVIMGPDMAVALTSGSIQLSGSASYTLDSATISSYAWTVDTSGSTVFTSGSHSPVFTFTTPGLYRAGLTVTSSGSVASTGHRTIYVYNETTHAPKDQINLLSMGANTADGGWTAQVEFFDAAGITNIADRGKVILIATDYYAGSAASIGPVAGQEHVLMVGRIDGDSIEYDREISSVKFTLQSGRYWIDKISGPSTGLATVSGEIDAGTNTNTWMFFTLLTIDKVLHHFFLWRSTVAEVMDVYKSTNTLTIGGITAGLGSIWSQVNSTVTSRMLMRLGVDRYNRLYPIEDPNLITAAARNNLPVVQALTGDDYTEKVQIKRVVTTPVAMLDVAALIGTRTDTIAMSRAPGELVYKQHGEIKTYDRCVVDSQATANALSGMLIAKLNSEYPEISVTLAENNRMFDIAPAMYATMSLTAAQNTRGVFFTDKRMLVKRIEYRIDPEKGYFTSEMAFEEETTGPPGVTVILPQEPIYPFPPQPPLPPEPPPLEPFPPIPVPPAPYIPIPPNPVSGSACGDTEPANGPYNTFMAQDECYTTDGIRPPAPFRCKVRSNTHTNKTTYEINGMFEKFNSTTGLYAYTADDAWYNVYGINTSGSRIATFTHDVVSGSGASGSGASGSSTRTGYYNGANSVDIEYVTIGFTAETPFRPTDVIRSTASYNGSAGQRGELFQAAPPEQQGTFGWGYTDVGIWIRHTNVISKNIRHALIGSSVWGNGAACWEQTYFVMSGSAPNSLKNQWFSASMTSLKRHVSGSPGSGFNPSGSSGAGAGYTDVDYPLQAGVAITATDVTTDPNRETDTVNGNWRNYALFYGTNPSTGVGMSWLEFDTRTLSASGSSQSPTRIESRFQTPNSQAGIYALAITRRLVCWTNTVGTQWILEPELMIAIKPIAQYRLTLGTMYMYNICAQPSPTPIPIDIGTG